MTAEKRCVDCGCSLSWYDHQLTLDDMRCRQCRANEVGLCAAIVYRGGRDVLGTTCTYKAAGFNLSTHRNEQWRYCKRHGGKPA